MIIVTMTGAGKWNFEFDVRFDFGLVRSFALFVASERI